MTLAAVRLLGRNALRRLDSWVLKLGQESCTARAQRELGAALQRDHHPEETSDDISRPRRLGQRA